MAYGRLYQARLQYGALANRSQQMRHHIGLFEEAVKPKKWVYFIAHRNIQRATDARPSSI